MTSSFSRRPLACTAALALSLAGCDGGTGPQDRGSVDVTVTTTGRVLDRDGYSLSVDGRAAVTVPANGVLSLTDLEPGTHTLAISGVSSNCTLDGDASRRVTVRGSEATPLAVAVRCVADRYAYYAFAGDAAGMGLFVARSDGSDPVVLKEGRSLEFARTDWSPDGHSLVYVRITGTQTSSIWSVDVSTRDSTLLVGSGGLNLHPQWSPNGNRLAFVSAPATMEFSPSRLTVVNADGTGRRSVTGYTGNAVELMPAWSPDGNSIAYRRGSELRIVNADGTGDRFVTDMAVTSYAEITWSPDGAWIVWDAWDPGTRTSELFRVRPDGSGRAAVTATPDVWEEAPSFMADGRIVFTANDFRVDPTAVAVDGSGRTSLVATPQTMERLAVWQ